MLGFWAACLLAGALGAQEPLLKTAEGFALPQPGRVFEFPRDHGSHPEFKIEWWYVTGHLYAAGGRRFGFQATFFRQAQAKAEAGEESTLYQHGQMHLAHMALLDAGSGKFLHQERLNRAGWDAEADENTLAVRNGNWSLKMIRPVEQAMQLLGTVRVRRSLTSNSSLPSRWCFLAKTASPARRMGPRPRATT